MLLLVLAACRSHPATQVLALFYASADLRASAASIRIVVSAPDGSVVLDETNPLGSGAAAALARVPLVPALGDASRTFEIEGELLDASGAVLSRVRAVSGYHDDELRELHLWFGDGCAIDCGPGRTCDRGVCVGACFDPSPQGEAERSTPLCGECEECAGGVCAALADGTACGCSETDACSAGACTTSAPVAWAAGGHIHTCAGLRSYDLFCWGSNRVGQLGSPGTSTAVPRSVELGELGSGAAGTDHTCWLQWDGQRNCWGYDGNGQLGRGMPEEAVFDTPVAPPAGDPAFSLVDAGWYFSCGLGVDGAIFCWGDNDNGACGRDPAVDALVPSPSQVGTRTDWVHVTAGGHHACAIDRDGRLFCWGYNSGGQLGVGDHTDRFSPEQAGCPDVACFDDWVAASAGDNHTCAIREGGELWCWGTNVNGQLGVVADESTRGARLDGRWLSVAGGESHTCAIAEDHSLWCWGRNDRGQVGTGDFERRSVPARVDTPGGDGWLALALGREHTCAIRADETLWCFGLDGDGQLGRGAPATGNATAAPGRVCFPQP